jgi:cytochrome oxidase Cu insertion factor (SCO1/SenC/PrrC family)
MKRTTKILLKTLALLALLTALSAVASAGLPVGASAPDFSLPTIKGDTLTLSQFRGQVVILHFWKSD